MRIFNPLTVIALLALGATNPTTAQYSAWLKQEIATTSAGNPLVALAAYALGDPIIQASTLRSNLLLFSIFSTRFDDTHKGITIGVAGNFFSISLSQEAAWVPGSPSPAFPHVVAAIDRETWKPVDGYVWVTQPPNGDLRVHWQPGKSSTSFRHLVAATTEGRWYPEEGYGWDINPPPVGQLGVHWVANKSSTKFAHVISGAIEGRWFPEDGYAWNINPPSPGELSVHWVPGVSSKQRAHIVSALTEGRWQPESGFRWVVDPPGPGDFRVEPLQPPNDPVITAEMERRTDEDKPTGSRAQVPDRSFLAGIDHGQARYALDLACSEADPPCPRWWEYARRVSTQLGVPLCSLEFQRDFGSGRYASARYLPLEHACVVPGALTSTGPLRCGHDGCCKPGATC